MIIIMMLLMLLLMIKVLKIILTIIMIIRVPPLAAPPEPCRRARPRDGPPLVKVHQRGVQWKQGAVVYIIL